MMAALLSKTSSGGVGIEDFAAADLEVGVLGEGLGEEAVAGQGGAGEEQAAVVGNLAGVNEVVRGEQTEVGGSVEEKGEARGEVEAGGGREGGAGREEEREVNVAIGAQGAFSGGSMQVGGADFRVLAQAGHGRLDLVGAERGRGGGHRR